MEETTSQPEESGRSLTSVIMIFTVGFTLVILIFFILSLILALVDAEYWGRIFEIIKDAFVIVLAVEGILIVVGLAIFIVQVARLINLLKNEIKPIVDNTRETTQTAKTTASFVKEHVAEPVITTQGFVAGVIALIRELFRLQRVVRHSPEVIGEEEKEAVNS